MLRFWKAAVIGVVVLSAQGCASFGGVESQQLAYNGKGFNSCLFGGVTQAANDHCVQQRWGSTGLLAQINEAALVNLPHDIAQRPCRIHVARLEKALQAHPEYSSQRIYSCPNRDRGVCHVSLMVTDSNGASYVMDNGAVLDNTRYTGSVASLDEFGAELGNVYWLNQVPEDARMIAAASNATGE